MRLNSNDVFSSAMEKLGLHPDNYQSQIDYRYRQSMIERIDQFLKDKQDCQFFIPIDHYSFSLNLMNTEFKQRLKRYNKLFEMKDNMKNIIKKIENRSEDLTKYQPLLKLYDRADILNDIV